jgi:glutamate dehydrogenase
VRGLTESRVMDELEHKGFIPADFIENEVTWFYKELGIDDSYFATESVEV